MEDIKVVTQEAVQQLPESWPSADEIAQRAFPDILQLLPSQVRLKEAGETISYAETGYFTVDDDRPEEDVVATLDLQSEREKYAAGEADSVARECWWHDIAARLVRRGLDSQQANEALQLRTAHKFSVLTPEGVGGAYEVFECGDEEAALRPEELSAIEATLTLIDQFSGGLIAEDPRARRIIVTSLGLTSPQDETVQVAGTAYEAATLINLGRIRSIAEESQLPTEVVLGVVLVHEILGHQLERFSEGKTHELFARYFDYSKDKQKGEIYKAIHAKITPKDPSHSESKPVREYGAVSAAEDMATSTEALVAKTMGWSEQVSKIDRFASTDDAYRYEIIMTMMDDVAKRLYDQGQGVGYVGSQLAYSEGPNGLEVSPARVLAHSTMSTDEVVQEEIARHTEKYKQLKELVYDVQPSMT